VRSRTKGTIGELTSRFTRYMNEHEGAHRHPAADPRAAQRVRAANARVIDLLEKG
jgi:hypothetical protein